MPQHVGRVDVLPPGIANVDRIHFPIPGHRPDTIRQAAIALIKNLVKIGKYFVRTKKHAGVDRIICLQIFANRS